MRYLQIGICAVLLTQCLPATAVNKCTDAAGKVSFQDAPCAAGKAENLTIKPSAGIAPSTVSSKPATDLATLNARGKIAEAIATGEPIVGMTASELNQAMGAPTTVNANDYNGIKKDQIIYERIGVTWLVYTDSGIVTAVQKRPQTSTVRAPVICPTGLEIRALETSASSILIGDASRAELLRQIGDAKKCGKS